MRVDVRFRPLENAPTGTISRREGMPARSSVPKLLARHRAGLPTVDENMHDKALVLFSGGQDSTTCLAWALERFPQVETIGFDYGQRHRVELDCRKTILDNLRSGFPHWATRLGQDHLLDLGLLGQVSDTALTAEKAIA